MKKMFVLGLVFLEGILWAPSLWADSIIKGIFGSVLKRRVATATYPELTGRSFRGVREYHQALSREMLPYASPVLTPTPLEQIHLESWGPSALQRAATYQAYLQALKSVETLSEGIAPLIYYQSTWEARTIYPQEIADITKEINATDQAIQRVRGLLSVQDPALNEGLLYLNRLREYFRVISLDVIVPFQWDNSLPKIVERPDRSFNFYEFLLKTPFVPEDYAEAKWYHRFLPSHSFAKAQPLPARLRVAVINDNKRILSLARNITERPACSGWQIDTYTDPEKFLSATDNITYDLVLADLMVAPGGGILLSAQLRMREFKGTILALTGGDPNPLLARSLYNAGMDGVIFIPEAYLGANFLDKIESRLRIYYHYKQKGKWKH